MTMKGCMGYSAPQPTTTSLIGWVLLLKRGRKGYPAGNSLSLSLSPPAPSSHVPMLGIVIYRLKDWMLKTHTWKISMEPRNHPFAKENHLPSTFIIVFHVNCPGCEQISDSALFKGKPYKFDCWKSRIIQAGFLKSFTQRKPTFYARACSRHRRWIPWMFYQFGQKSTYETTFFGVHKSPNITAVRIQVDDCFYPGKNG